MIGLKFSHHALPNIEGNWNFPPLVTSISIHLLEGFDGIILQSYGRFLTLL